MKKELNKELVKAAVDYWSNFLKEPDSVVLDNGEPTQFAMMNMLKNLGGTPTYQPEAIEDFEVALSDLIEIGLKRFGSGFSLNVDYHPDNTLTKALNTGIKKYNSMSIFPCKTNMSINIEEDTVEVSEGYGKPWRIIYPNPWTAINAEQEREDNTHLLTNGYNYVVFMNQECFQIIIDFKTYDCEFDAKGLGLDPEADKIKVLKMEDKYYAKGVPTNALDLREIKVFNCNGEFNMVGK